MTPAPPAPPRSIKTWIGWLALCAWIAASVISLDLQWRPFMTGDALPRMGRFVGELVRPQLDPAHLVRVLQATLETLAMSAIGTALAALVGLALALPAARTHAGDVARWRAPTRLLLNALRSIPELVWAALLLIAAGLGPLAGTLALALHTTGVLGRLFAETLENQPQGPADALRTHGVSPGVVLAYATLPQAAPQLISYTLYRWENNIRAAAVLGVVGAGGLGQMLSFHLSLFQMPQTSTVLLAMMALVALVDGLSAVVRQHMQR
jgi:phosphonate transport system permease protein